MMVVMVAAGALGLVLHLLQGRRQFGGAELAVAVGVHGVEG